LLVPMSKLIALRCILQPDLARSPLSFFLSGSTVEFFFFWLSEDLSSDLSLFLNHFLTSPLLFIPPLSRLLGPFFKGGTFSELRPLTADLDLTQSSPRFFFPFFFRFPDCRSLSSAFFPKPLFYPPPLRKVIFFLEASACGFSLSRSFPGLYFLVASIAPLFGPPPAFFMLLPFFFFQLFFALNKGHA